MLGLISILETFAGFKWDYHPDARTYITSTHDWQNILSQNPFLLINNAFYLYVDLLGKDRFVLVALNYFYFLLTNAILFHAVSKWNPKKKFRTILVIIFLLNPYRLHLANFVLKDTLILLVVCLVFYKYTIKGKVPFLTIFTSFLLRYASLLYYPFLFLKSVKILIICTILLAIIVINAGINEFVQTLLTLSAGEMRVRSFDTTPNFSSYGPFAGLVRAVVWPCLILTGAFVLFNQSLPIMIVAISSLSSTIYWSYMISIRKFLGITYLPLALLAIIVPGFVAYQRYALPIILFGSMLLIKNKPKNTE